MEDLLQYKAFIAQLTKLMEDFRKMKKDYFRWQGGLESAQASRREY